MKERSRQEKIEGIRAGIAAKREAIREEKAPIAAKREFCDRLSDIDERMQQVEDSEEPLAGCTARVRELLAPVPDAKLTDWGEVARIKGRQIDEARAEIDKLAKIIAATGDKLARAASDFEALKGEHAQFETAAVQQDTALAAEMRELEERLRGATARIGELQRRKRTLSAGIETLLARLAGTVECPACAHRFLVSRRTVRRRSGSGGAGAEGIGNDGRWGDCLLDDGLEAEKVEQMISAVRGEVRTLAAERHDWQERMAKGKRAVEAAEYEMEEARSTSAASGITSRPAPARWRICAAVSSTKPTTPSMRHAKARSGNPPCPRAYRRRRKLHRHAGTDRDRAGEGHGRGAYRIAPGIAKGCRRKSSQVAERRRELSERIAALQSQQQTFIQFKTYLANTKIDALAGML